MTICSLAFLALCGIAAIVFHLLPVRRPRHWFLAILNLAFLATFMPNRSSWACLMAFVVGTYVVLALVRAWPSGRLVFLGIATTVAVFLVLKKYSFLQNFLPTNFWQHPLALVGLSYMLFKFIHVLVDTWQGQIAPVSFASYANYQLAFFTLIAGPIQRYNDFQRFWDASDSEPQDTRHVLLAWNRILTGMIKIGGLAALASYAYEQASADLGSQPRGDLLLAFAICFYSYPIYLYFNFAGYTDVMIGCAQLLGCELPENFNQPYLARNVIDFWNRWHMSLTHWIRDYVFMASYKVAAEHFASWARLLGYGLLFLSLFLAGVWHGSTLNFAVFGALHGLGALVNRAYGDGLQSCLGRAGFKRYQKNSWVRWGAIGLTFHFVCFSLLFFASPRGGGLRLLRSVSDQLL
jgi:D-alanyl-lipoteichoic acid acyltransferase DltB (MBOAT superfamily)